MSVCVGYSKSPVYVKNTLEESPVSTDIISLAGGLVDLEKPFRWMSEKAEICICGGTGTDSTVPTNTVPITTGTVTDSGSECTGFIG